MCSTGDRGVNGIFYDYMCVCMCVCGLVWCGILLCLAVCVCVCVGVLPPSFSVPSAEFHPSSKFIWSLTHVLLTRDPRENEIRVIQFVS